MPKTVTVRDVMGDGPRHPKQEDVEAIVSQVRGNALLTENFYQNFEGLANSLEDQATQGKGQATESFRETCAYQAANVRRFVAAVRQKLGG